MVEIRISHDLWCCIISLSLYFLLQLYPSPKLFSLTAIHLSITSQVLMCYISLSVALSRKLPNKQFDFPLSFFSACSLVCYLAKGKPFAVKRKGHHHWSWTSNYHDVRCLLGNIHIKITPNSQHPSTLRYFKGRQDKPVRQKHGSLNNYQSPNEPQGHKWTDPSHKGVQRDALSQGDWWRGIKISVRSISWTKIPWYF